MYKLILTVDYEIWGNGTGSFSELVYEPTQKMLKVCDSYNAKLTIFAEMGHYWAMKRYKDFFKNEINLFEMQLKNAVDRGHDVQMHLHPQWIDATYKKGIWNLNFNKWACSELSYNEISELLKKGKNDLEDLIKQVKKEYKCIAFRAGGWCALPSKNLVRALIKNGFLIDSSVAKGRVLKSDVCNIDYTNANSAYIPWKINPDNINSSNFDGKLIEFPIFSTRRFFPLRFFDKNILNLTKKIKNIKRDNNNGPVFHNQKKDLLSLILRKFRGDYYQNDFCTITSNILLRNLLRLKIHTKKCIPIVLISHSKNFIDYDNFDHFISSVNDYSNFNFSTFYESYNLINQHD